MARGRNGSSDFFLVRHEILSSAGADDAPGILDSGLSGIGAGGMPGLMEGCGHPSGSYAARVTSFHTDAAWVPALT